MGDAVIDNKSDEIEINGWVVVKGPAGSFLGKPRVFNDNEDVGSEGWKSEVINAISQGDCIELKPVFEFIAPLRPIQGPEGKMLFTRDPVVVGVDFILHQAPIYVKAAAVYFCMDMQEEDAKTYKSFASQASRAAIEARTKKLGLDLAPSLPPRMKGMARA